MQNCLPGLVSTKMAKDPDVNIFVPTPEDYAESLLSTVGKQRTTHGWWPHELQVKSKSRFCVFLKNQPRNCNNCSLFAELPCPEDN